MRLKANDTMLVSSVKSDNILADEEFEVSDEVGRDFVDRGLAVEVPGAKAEPAPKNKMEPAPANKGIISAFDHDGDGKDGGAPKGGNKRKLSRKGK